MAKKKQSKLDEVFKHKSDAEKPSLMKEKVDRSVYPVKVPKPKTKGRSGGLRKEGCPAIVVNAVIALKDYGTIMRLVDEYKKRHPKKYDSREFIIYILTGLVKLSPSTLTSPKGFTKIELAHAKAVLAEAKSKKEK